MASVRRHRRLHRVRWILAAGTVLVVAGFGLLLMDAHARLDASEHAVTFTDDEREMLGPDADDMLASIRLSSLVQSLFTSSDVRTFDVTVTESGEGGRSISITEEAPPMVVSSRGSWRAPPVALPALAGVAMIVSALFLGAARWRRPVMMTDQN